MLYSNLWIAVCAASMCWYSQLVLAGKFKVEPLAAFIFCATLLLYALHRLVGLNKAKGFKDKGRYLVIERYRSHIGVYAIIAGLATCWFAWQLLWRVWWCMLPVVGISLAYVLPIFSRGRRLRDFPYIKIFLIAFSWSWITVLIPAVEFGLYYNIPLYLLFLERFFFIFAITIPFDIRDLEIDRFNGVRTLPAVLGIHKAKLLALSALTVSILPAAMNYRLDTYSNGSFIGLLFSLVVTGTVIWLATPNRHDYYFSGLLDGMMILQFAGVWVGLQ